MDGIPLVDQLTAAGRGAVAVVRLRSSDLDVLNDRFVSASGKLPGAQPVGRILFGKWGDEEIVIVRTGESEWEINCHGGEAAVGKICDDLAGNKTGQTSSIDHAITNQLIRCRSRRTAEYLLAQSEGVFRSFLETLRSTQDVQLAAEQIQSVMSRQTFAEHLVEQWKMAIVGQPNAGKSSLLNALIGYERAIVFDQPGTTRDRIEAELIIDGWPVQAVDTAGIRVTNDAIESEGVAAAQSSIADCDVCLLVVDSTIGWSAADAEIASGISERTPTAILFNKSDLATNPSFTTGIGGVSEQKISATNGDGIPTLLEWISAAVVPQPPAIDEPLPVIAELTRAFAEFQNSDDLQQLHHALKHWL